MLGHSTSRFSLRTNDRTCVQDIAQFYEFSLAKFGAMMSFAAVNCLIQTRVSTLYYRFIHTYGLSKQLGILGSELDGQIEHKVSKRVCKQARR
jgi:hypothetical protein